MKKIRIQTVLDTKKAAQQFARTLKGGQVVALFGGLGSGKTTFTQYAARALGVQGQITSPTFVLYRCYDLPTSVRGIRRLCHVDLYRLGERVSPVGFEEEMSDLETVTFIEWAERIDSLPEGAVRLEFVIAGKRRYILWR